VLDDFRIAVPLVDRNGSHSGSLHGHILGNLFVDLLVEADQRTQLAVHVDIGHAHRGFDLAVVSQLDLLTGLARFLGHDLGYGLAVLHNGQQCIEISRIGFDSDVEDRIGSSDEISILSHKVGFASEAEHVALLTHNLRGNDTLRSSAVGTLGGNQFALLTDDILSAVEIAFGLYQRLFAIHHTGSGHRTEFSNISSFNFHNFPFCYKR